MNGKIYVGILMIVVHDEDRRRKQDIRLEADVIPCGDHGPAPDLTAIPHNDGGLRAMRILGNSQPNMRSDINRIPQAYSIRNRLRYFASVMDGNTPPKSAE